jgi:hypothetical protein
MRKNGTIYNKMINGMNTTTGTECANTALGISKRSKQSKIFLGKVDIREKLEII